MLERTVSRLECEVIGHDGLGPLGRDANAERNGSDGDGVSSGGWSEAEVAARRSLHRVSTEPPNAPGAPLGTPHRPTATVMPRSASSVPASTSSFCRGIRGG